MKKILISSMASILLLSSTTYAQGAATHNTHMVQKTSFSKKDAQALFGTNKVKVSTLNNGEMAKTEGEFWWHVLWYVGVSLLGGAITHTVSDQSGYLHGNQNPGKRI